MILCLDRSWNDHGFYNKARCKGVESFYMAMTVAAPQSPVCSQTGLGKRFKKRKRPEDSLKSSGSSSNQEGLYQIRERRCIKKFEFCSMRLYIQLQLPPFSLSYSDHPDYIYI